jgi:argininosuccinate lyase
MGRGRSERIVIQAIGSVAETVGKLANDVITYSSQNYRFLSIPNDLTTGSSIMPHKSNPDIFEIIRARCNQLRALPYEFMLITANLMTGYHRDLQLIKENFIPAVFKIRECVHVTTVALAKLTVRDDILNEDIYRNIYSVEAINKLVLEGIPFRDAYLKVATLIQAGKFKKPESLNHVHEGSIGNLKNKQIKKSMSDILSRFKFEKVEMAYSALISD